MTAHRHLTPTAQLMDAHLSGDLVDTVLRLKGELRSWRLVARSLSDLTGIRVSHETVRGWAIEWGWEPEEAGAA